MRVAPRHIAAELRRRGLWREADGHAWSYDGVYTTVKSPAWKRMNELEQMLRAIAGDGGSGNGPRPLGTPMGSPGGTPESAGDRPRAP